MSSLRERPRLVAARALAVAVVLIAGVAIGALADTSDPEVPAREEAQLHRVQLVSGRQSDRLDRASAALERARAERDEALERSRDLARADLRLRRALRAAKRDLRRQQRTGRSR